MDSERCDDEQYDVIRRHVERGQNDIISRAPFNESHYIDARLSSTESLFMTNDSSDINDIGNDQPLPDGRNTIARKTYHGMLRLIAGSLQGNTDFSQMYNNLNKNDRDSTANSNRIPTLVDTARQIASEQGVTMDEKQYIAYEIIACSVLLRLINDGQDSKSLLYSYLQQSMTARSEQSTKMSIVNQLKARGAKDQLLMFLTGPAGAGKSTAMMAASRFCFLFFLSVSIFWSDTTFLIIAYTGSAASIVGGRTICKGAFLLKKGSLTEEDKREWKDVMIVIIDEISFMSDDQLQILDQRMKELGDRTKPYGGYSIVFSGDFRQLEPTKTSSNNLLFSRHSSQLWDSSINSIIILDNEHRFKEDPQYGIMLKNMWQKDLSIQQRKRINTKVVNKTTFKLPPKFEGDVCYACPTNKERNAISAGNCRKHILATHPSFDSIQSPPEHTIVIEADIRSSASKQKSRKIDNVIRHQIITTCGDANVRNGTKGVDPALCLYKGCYLICTINNDSLTEKVPRGNGTICRLIKMKLKESPTSLTHRKYYAKKVNTVGVKDVEWIECEHIIKTQAMIHIEKQIDELSSSINECTLENGKVTEKIETLKERLVKMAKTRRFRLQSQMYSVKVHVKSHKQSTSELKFRCQMTQFPVLLNDATTGHKLQGMTKDAMIVTSWPKWAFFKNWEYTVLSRVRTLEGLYLFEPISMTKSFAACDELKAYYKRARALEKKTLKRRKQAMDLLNKH